MPTPAIHFTASERMRELISDISQGERKGFYAKPRGSERGARLDERWELERETERERERVCDGPQESLGPPFFLPSTVDADFFVVPMLPFVSPGEKRNTLS